LIDLIAKKILEYKELASAVVGLFVLWFRWKKARRDDLKAIKDGELASMAEKRQTRDHVLQEWKDLTAAVKSRAAELDENIRNKDKKIESLEEDLRDTRARLLQKCLELEETKRALKSTQSPISPQNKQKTPKDSK